MRRKWIGTMLAAALILSSVSAIVTATAAEAEALSERLTESGSIAAEETEESSTEAIEAAEEGTVSKETITRAESWEDIYKALGKARNRYDDRYYETYAVEDLAVTSAKSEASAVNAAADYAAGTDYSETNLRDSRVDEGDIVKTDGSYIYILQQDRYLTIVKADGENSEVVSRSLIAVQETKDTVRENVLLADQPEVYSITPREMYVDGDRLVMLLSEERYKEDSTYSWDTATYTVAAAVDISDRANPAAVGSFAQEGTYQQSRRMNGTTYIYTKRWPELGSSADDSDLKVMVGEEELSPEDYYIPKLITDQSYLVFASVKDETPTQPADAGVFVSGGEDYYVSENSLYCLNGYWGDTGSKTQITRFSLEDGQFIAQASCSLPGYVNNTWSIDEYDHHLRVLVTYMGASTADILQGLLQGESLVDLLYDSEWTRRNALYVLDENLERTSRIGNIAKNEEIKSARFMGETAYFVTYENTDPLFSLDLSDPEEPKMLGELKITGFSSYLHPFGDNRLLGIGYETDPDTGQTLGLKLTMFDTSDKRDVKVLYTEMIPGIRYCQAIENYKSILAAPERGLIGFYYDDRYLLYHYEEDGGFTSGLVYDFLSVGLAGDSSPDTMRGLYIGDTFYMAGETYVAGFALSYPLSASQGAFWMKTQ